MAVSADHPSGRLSEGNRVTAFFRWQKSSAVTPRTGCAVESSERTNDRGVLRFVRGASQTSDLAGERSFRRSGRRMRGSTDPEAHMIADTEVVDALIRDPRQPPARQPSPARQLTDMPTRTPSSVGVSATLPEC